MPPKPARKCDRLIEIRAAFLACGSLAAGRARIPSRVRRCASDDARGALEMDAAQRRRATQADARASGASSSITRTSTRSSSCSTAIGAFGAVLQLEDVRALRETKNRIHRLVNTEAANLERTAQAAAAQRRVIEYLESAYGLPQLSPALREVAELRLGASRRVARRTRAPLQSADRQADRQQPPGRARRGWPAASQRAGERESSPVNALPCASGSTASAASDETLPRR